MPVLAGVRVVAEHPAQPQQLPFVPNGRIAWSPDGSRLLYIGAPPAPDEPGPLMLLDLAQPAPPVPVAPGSIGNAAWHPDRRSFAYTRAQVHPGVGFIPSIYQRQVGNGRPRELLPPGVSDPISGDMLQCWLNGRTLAFDQNAGTGLRRLLLLDTAERKLIPTPPLSATYFHWSPAGDRLAGQYTIWPAPPYFWIWDRLEGQFPLSPAYGEGGLPGASQFFEAWSPDGRSALFTAWENFPYATGAMPVLYRLDVDTRTVHKVANDAALAAWGRDWIAYVTLGPRLTLKVTRAADGQVLWTDDLGPRPAGNGGFAWTYRPRFGGPYVAYRTVGAEWRVSRADRKEVQPVYQGEQADLVWAPDGSRIALLQTNATARLYLLANPVWTE